jgi:predicted amidohydrolase YtcJ
MPDARDRRITVFTARRIITMSPGWPEARVVAVRDGRIVSLGFSLDDLKPWTGRHPHEIDRRLEGKVITPGFIDPHQHPLLGALTANLPNVSYLDTPQAYRPDIPGAKSEAEVFARLRKYDADLKDPGQTLLAWGWDVPAMGRHLSRRELDRISATRPIVVWDCSEHHAYTNSAFITARGVPKDLPIVGVGRDADGELNGQFLGVAAATYALSKELPNYLQPENARRLMRFLIDLNRRNGITTTTDHSMGALSFDLEARLLDGVFNDPGTPERLMAIPAVHSALARHGSVEKAMAAIRALQQTSTERLIFRGVKFFTDDSFNGLTFRPGAPGYIDGSEGIWVTPPGELYSAIEPWWCDGQQIFVHSIGEEAQDATLDALRRLQERFPRFDHRFTFEHFGMARYDQMRRLKALGACANVNVYFVWLRGGMYPNVLGRDRAQHLAPLATLLRVGVPTTFHSDTPVAPPKPLLGMSVALARYSHGEGATLGPEERLTIEQAMRMITIDAAYVLGLDQMVGSIEPGKFADFTVLERDPYEVEPLALAKVPVWGTVMGGKVFPASEITPPD